MLHTTTIQIASELLALISEIDEFKGLSLHSCGTFQLLVLKDLCSSTAQLSLDKIGLPSYSHNFFNINERYSV